MLHVGLTGGIGSGKSTVAKIFAELGIAVIDADVIAREITEPNTALLAVLTKHFGKEILNDNGSLNRRQLRDIVFYDKNKRLWLEKALHPPIIQEMKKQIKDVKSPYCILAIPLLTETNTIDLLDHILVIDAPEELQVQRAQLRDDATPTEIEAIIKLQSSRVERLAFADDVIINDGNLEELREQVLKMHKHYLVLSS